MFVSKPRDTEHAINYEIRTHWLPWDQQHHFPLG
jgi:hypothetical protein